VCQQAWGSGERNDFHKIRKEPISGKSQPHNRTSSPLKTEKTVGDNGKSGTCKEKKKKKEVGWGGGKHRVGKRGREARTLGGFQRNKLFQKGMETK